MRCRSILIPRFWLLYTNPPQTSLPRDMKRYFRFARSSIVPSFTSKISYRNKTIIFFPEEAYLNPEHPSRSLYRPLRSPYPYNSDFIKVNSFVDHVCLHVSFSSTAHKFIFFIKIFKINFSEPSRTLFICASFFRTGNFIFFELIQFSFISSR